jgi:hypothetical protein
MYKTWCTSAGDQLTDDDWTIILWDEEEGDGFDVATDGEITVTNAGNYMIDVVLTADYNADNQIHYVRLQKQA